MIYLDNAATTFYKPKSVITAVTDAMYKYSANPGRGGHKPSITTAEKILSVREKAANYFKCDRPEKVCFTANCTAAINTILFGVLKHGDHVIISSLEHNAVLRPLVYLKESREIEFDIADVDPNNTDSILNEIKRLIKNNTKLIFVTHASNVVGCVLPIQKIGEICADNQILFAVDSAQSAGHINIDMKKYHIDFLAVAPHKGLYAPLSTGILISACNIDDPLIKGGTGVNSNSLYQPDSMPERIESGSLPTANIVGIGAGIDFLESYRFEEMKKREMLILEYFNKKLRSMGATLYINEGVEVRAPVLSFNFKNYSSEEVADYLSEKNIAVRAGLHCAPLAHKTIGTSDKGTVRISTSVFNKFEDAEKTLFYLKKL